MANKDLDTRGLGARDLGTKYFFASCINGSEIIFNIRRLDQDLNYRHQNSAVFRVKSRLKRE